MKLYEVDEAKKRSLARQIQRLLNQFILMPEYIEAVEKAKGAWYMTDKSAKESHEFVDRVDALKVTIYANSILCLNTIPPARVLHIEEESVLSKTWTLDRSWIPEGERFALEISFIDKEISELLKLYENEVEANLQFVENRSFVFSNVDDGYDSAEEVEEEDIYDGDNGTECDVENTSSDPIREESFDEQLSDVEDLIDEDEECIDLEVEEEVEANFVNASCSVKKLGSSNSPFSIFSDLLGTVYIKSGMKCQLLIDGEDQEERQSQLVQNCWKIENPDEILKIEFLVTKEAIESRSMLTCKKLDLTEDVGNSLIDLLKESDIKSAEKAKSFIKSGTVTNISWRVHWSEILRSLDSGKDLQSPLFTPLPVEESQPHMRAIIAGGKNKMGVKKVSSKGMQTSLVVGMMMWREENPEVKIIGNLKTLKKGVKDLQVKDIDWEDLGDEEFVRIDIFLFSSLACQV